MSFKVPSDDKRLSQINSSDVVGNIFATKNIDLDERGYIKMSAPLLSIYDTSKDAEFDNVQSMFTSDGKTYFLGDDLFRASGGFIRLNPSFTNVTASETTPPSPGPEEDGIYFNGTDIVTDGTSAKYLTGSTWTSFGSWNSSVPTCVDVFPAQNALLVGNDNDVYMYDTSYTLVRTLVLPSVYQVHSITVNGSIAYIATRHKGGGEAVLFLWNGTSTDNNGAYGVGTFEIPTVKKYQSTVALMTSLGQLLAFNGSGFTELASLPVYFSRLEWADANNDYGGISNRGMIVDGDIIYLTFSSNVDAIDSAIIYNQPGGLWCYDPSVGLYHRNGMTNNRVVSDTNVDINDVNTTTNVITVSGVTVPATGNPVFVESNRITGVQNNRWYWVIKVTDTTLKLAETKANAYQNIEVDFTGYGSGDTDLHFVEQNDYGQFLGRERTSVLILNNSLYSTPEVGRLVVASDVYDKTMADKNRLMIECNKVPSRSYFILPKMYASAHKDTFNTINLRFRPLDYGDSIVVKYRTAERVGLPIVPAAAGELATENRITWTSSTTFTTAAAPTSNDYMKLFAAQVGDEVEILAGAFAGATAHITALSRSGLQWTVTIDEALPVSNGDLSTCMINNWTTIDTITQADGLTSKTIAVDTSADWVQFKIEMRGVGVAIEDTFVTNKAYERTR